MATISPLPHHYPAPMARATCRQIVATLVAAAALGLLVPAPLHAQSRPLRGAKALLATLQATELGSAGVSCCNLGGHTTYLLADGTSLLPAVVILTHPSPRNAQPGELEALAERFIRAYKLRDYRISTARDNSAVLLIRDTQTTPRDDARVNRGVRLLAKETQLAPALVWLNEHLGGAPHRLVGTRLVWRQEISTNNGPRELALALNLLQGMPCVVELQLRGLNPPAVPDALSRQLGLALSTPTGTRATALRRQLSAKPLGYQSGSIALIRAGGETGIYRLGTPEALAALREHRGPEATLPRLPRATWADELATPAPAQAEAAAPAQDALSQSPVNGWQTAPAAAEQEAATPATAQPSMPSPAEARESYAQRLRAL